ncbi:hypothetical protein Peur_022317 [Populus x canadensis]
MIGYFLSWTLNCLTLNKPIFNYFSFTPTNPTTKLLYPNLFSFFKLTHLTKLKTSPVCFSYKNPSDHHQNPKQETVVIEVSCTH